MEKRKYPEKRKPKRNHTQWFDMERIIKQWNFVPDLYYVFQTKDGWFVFQKDGFFEGNYENNGEYFRKVFPLPFWEYGDGCIVYGYVGIIKTLHMSILEGRFVFLKPLMTAAYILHHSATIKTEKNLIKYKENEIWKVKQ